MNLYQSCINWYLYFKKHASYLFAIPILLAFLGCLYSWSNSPIYTAKLTFVTENDKSSSGLGGYAGLASQFGLDLSVGSSSAFEGDNLIEFMTQRSIIENTLLSETETPLGKMILIDFYLKNLKKYSSERIPKKIVWKNYINKRNRLQDSIIQLVYKDITDKNLEVSKLNKKVSIIIVKFNNENEYFAKTFTELLVNNLVDYYTKYRNYKSLNNISILQKKADSVRQILYNKISVTANLRDFNLNPLKSVAQIQPQNNNIDLQANTIIYGELIKNLELTKIAFLKETPFIKIIDEPIFPLPQKKIGRLLMALIWSVSGFFIVIIVLTIVRLLKIDFNDID